MTDEVDLDAVRTRYAAWADKGATTGDRRLTLLPEATACRPGERVRFWHVLEATGPVELFVMGPKPVRGETVDGVPVTPPPEPHPFVPEAYDGRTLRGPGLDPYWAPTEHRFDDPGTHAVVWQLGDVRSNEVRVSVG